MENKKSDFSEWYNEILDLAELSDKRYPVKGMNIWLPYGFQVMRNIDNMIREKFYEDQFEEVMFPSLISRDMFEIEFEHIKGFENELFWISSGGKEKLEEDLAMRPTSEAAMYPMFRLWIRDHSDLPKKIFQIVQVYRYETKHTRPFIRSRDIHFIECHTAHEKYEESESQMEEYRRQWAYFTEMLALKYFEVRRPEWDKFPGAKYTVAFDTVMPSGRTLQIGTIHEYGEGFARNYDIKYSDEIGEQKYVNQTTFGMSERLVAAIIGIHGDDKGLRLPPAVAPYQVIIVPIPGKGVEEYSRDIFSRLIKAGIRTKIDERENYTPGYKYNYWEMKGVPVRIEIGEKEVNRHTITVAKRTGGKKTELAQDDINSIFSSLDDVHKKLKEEAASLIEKALENNGDENIRFPILCTDEKCSRDMEKRTGLSMMGHILNINKKGECEICGSEGAVSLLSRPY
ncbi:proline--tRNA ligase [Caldiplasma sukawensis]